LKVTVMTMMNPPQPPSRLLARLDAAIAAERVPLRADILRAERATYLARQGRTDEARKELEALHQRHDGRPDFEMSAWLSIVESLMSYFSDMSPTALDKMRRAQALSKAAGLAQLQALSAAWLAQMDYLRLDLQSMARNLVVSLELAEPTNHAARSRASLVVALAYHTAERLDLALPWYGRARDHATTLGDDATISALMHNMAWIRAVNMRNASFTGSSDRGEGEHALMAAESTWTFDYLVGVKSLDSYVPLLHAQILAIQGKASMALEIYEKHLKVGVEQGLARLYGAMLADQAWCRMQLGQVEGARQDAEAAERLLEAEGNFDDRAPGFSRLAQVYALLGDTVAATRSEVQASILWQGHARTRDQLVLSLQPVASLPG
jgi:tetratricopeptide (TPR) repeat protein